MLKNILIATQDKNLQALCQPLKDVEGFYLFSDIHYLSQAITDIKEGVAVFVDVEWPNNQSGYNVAREIKKRQDGSLTILITDRIDEVKLQWCNKVNAEIVEKVISAFLGKLAPITQSLGFKLPPEWQPYLDSQTISAPPILPVAKAEAELERILGPMGSLLLQEAMNGTNGNLSQALKKVAEFGTTAVERAQIISLSDQFK